MAVHHIAVQPVRTRRCGAAHFVVELAEVAGKERGSDEDGRIRHREKLKCRPQSFQRGNP
jgi:hypothetical protein